MTVHLWAGFVATLLALMCTPGPSHLLMLANSMAHGPARASATAIGDLSANMMQMLAAALGLAAVLVASETAFTFVKWAGVAYLAWLGVKQLRRSFKPAAKAVEPSAPSLKLLWLQGFVTSAANPKAIVFFAALFPQFLNPQAPLAPQLLVLGLTFIVIDGSFLTFYGASAGFLAKRLRGPLRVWIDRVSGAGLIAAAGLLSLKAVAKGS